MFGSTTDIIQERWKVFSAIFQRTQPLLPFLILLLWPTCSSPPADDAGLASAFSCALDLGLIKSIVNRWSLGFLQIPSALAAASISTPLGRSLGPPRNPSHLCCFALSLMRADGPMENSRTCQPHAGQQHPQNWAHLIFPKEYKWRPSGLTLPMWTCGYFFQKATSLWCKLS